jgi:hypothetical protein
MPSMDRSLTFDAELARYLCDIDKASPWQNTLEIIGAFAVTVGAISANTATVVKLHAVIHLPCGDFVRADLRLAFVQQIRPTIAPVSINPVAKTCLLPCSVSGWLERV